MKSIASLELYFDPVTEATMWHLSHTPLSIYVGIVILEVHLLEGQEGKVLDYLKTQCDLDLCL